MCGSLLWLVCSTRRNAQDWDRHQGADSSAIAVLFVLALSGSIAAARRLALMIGGDIPMEDEAYRNVATSPPARGLCVWGGFC